MDDQIKDDQPKPEAQDDEPDENMRLFLYGNIKIRDVDTGEILVNKRF